MSRTFEIKPGFVATALGVPFMTAMYFTFLDFLFERIGSTTIGCGATGMGYNTCYWHNVTWGFNLAFVLGLLTVSCIGAFTRIGTLKEYLWGLLYLALVVPINILGSELVYTTLNLWGNARGAFNDFFVPLVLVVNVVVLGLLCFEIKSQPVAKRPIKNKRKSVARITFS